MMKKISFIILFHLALILTINAQENLLLNSNADLGITNWKAIGNAKIEIDSEGNQMFVIRNRGAFSQTIKLPDGSNDKYVLLIGRGSSERVDSDGVITGLPYLYGYLLNFGYVKGGSINTYLTGQKLLGRVQNDTEWVIMYGIFQVPKGTAQVKFSLHQAERRYVPQNGSAAKFDDVGLYLFQTKNDALEFVRNYE